MTNTPHEPVSLSAIRERDAAFIPHRPTNGVADYDRRELLSRLTHASNTLRGLTHPLTNKSAKKLRAEIERVVEYLES